jgi:hypothetical protein
MKREFSEVKKQVKRLNIYSGVDNGLKEISDEI